MTASFTKGDEVFMHHALELARRAVGAVGPHALVGAVVVKNNVIVGKGYYRWYGDRHAEVQAIEEAGEQARGAELFVNLEPCCHIGRNPPCTDVIIRAGIQRVVFSLVDPNPKVSGKGRKILEAFGIDVTSGLLAEESAQLNRAFFKFVSTQKPWLFRIVERMISHKGYLTGRIIAPDIQKLVPVVNLAFETPRPPQVIAKGWPSIGWLDLDEIEKHEISNEDSIVATAIVKATLARLPILVLRSSTWIHTKEIIDEDEVATCRLRISKFTPLQTSFGSFRAVGFECVNHNVYGVLISQHPDEERGIVTVRIQSECIPAHVLRDTLCDCANQLEEGLNLIKNGGVFIYLSGHEGRGLGIVNKLNEYALREWHHEVPRRDVRTFACAAGILLAFNIRTVRLLTENPEKATALIRSGIRIV